MFRIQNRKCWKLFRYSLKLFLMRFSFLFLSLRNIAEHKNKLKEFSTSTPTEKFNSTFSFREINFSCWWWIFIFYEILESFATFEKIHKVLNAEWVAYYIVITHHSFHPITVNYKVSNGRFLIFYKFTVAQLSKNVEEMFFRANMRWKVVIKLMKKCWWYLRWCSRTAQTHSYFYKNLV